MDGLASPSVQPLDATETVATATHFSAKIVGSQAQSSLHLFATFDPASSIFCSRWHFAHPNATFGLLAAFKTDKCSVF
jgi:hypothetical protein